MKRVFLLAALAACGGAKKESPAPHRAPQDSPVESMRQPAPHPMPPAPKVRPRAEEKVALLPTPLAGDPLKVTIHRLSNGMIVYLSPDAADVSAY